MENLITNSSYIRTQSGYIHIKDIPEVRSEPLITKFEKSLVFFTAIIVIILVFIYLVHIKQLRTEEMINIQKEEALNQTNRFSKTNLDTYEYIPHQVNAQMINVYNQSRHLPLENIVLIDINNNIIDIDIQRNYFLKIYNIGEHGVMFSMDLGSEKTIREIILISKETEYINAVNIDLYDSNRVKVWSFNDYLPDLRENSITIKKLICKPIKSEYEVLGGGPTDQEKIINNENHLAFRLSENNESYMLI